MVATTLTYYRWAILMPVLGVTAYVFDGIFIGATWTRAMLLTNVGRVWAYFPALDRRIFLVMMLSAIPASILGAIGQVSGVAIAGNIAFTLATSIILIIFAIKAWKGKPVHIEAIDPLTNWLEDKIHKKDS